MFGRRRVDEGNGFVETDPTARYGRFDEVLGKGAMKTVYRAFDEVNGIEVAWNQAKICDVMRSPEALQCMYSEVHLLSSLCHESIIKFHASWIDPAHRTFNFITELFTSGTLREYRQRYQQVNIKAVKSWARQILEGLVYLHSHDPPVIHRDLKCDNIFVNGHLGQVKIGDLGLAAMLRGAQCAHSVIGTLEFMAPEVYEEEYNELVDIYSFGMCMLEMLTSEYPYSECSNPAQIYKKVTYGKLPDAFHRIQVPEAKRFIGRCLETTSRRPSAEELLLDPFLTFEEDHPNPSTLPSIKNKKPAHEDEEDILPGVHHDEQLQQVTDDPDPDVDPVVKKSTDMTITGKMNPDADTIFLKVQIADHEGKMSNIYFPFDVDGDTPIDVANEMVEELDITDREPSEIAEKIAQEISRLVPAEWKDHLVGGGDPAGDCCGRHAYNYVDDEQDRRNHPFYCLSSSPASSSSQGSSVQLLAGISSSQCSQGFFCHQYNYSRQPDWLGDGAVYDQDDDNEYMSSVPSSKLYSAVNYTSGGEQEKDSSLHCSQYKCITRFCPQESSESMILSNQIMLGKYCNYKMWAEGEWMRSGGKRWRRVRRRRMRNQSMMDVRSQLLHKALVEELNKRMFNTVGAVEGIGFQLPFSSSSSSYHRHHYSISNSNKKQ